MLATLGWTLICFLPSTAAEQSSLTRRLDALHAHASLRSASVGTRVVELPSGRELYRRGAERALIPASNMKLLTMAAALRVLGESYRYRTVIALSGDDLVVIGSGDPAIGSEHTAAHSTSHFHQWATHLWQRGIRVIDGDLVLDDTLFDREFVHPQWESRHLHRHFAAPVGALSVNGNCLEVTVRPGLRSGAPASVRLDPAGSGLSVVGSIRTIGSAKRHVWSLYRKTGSTAVRVSGRFYRKARPDTGRVTVQNPTRFFGAALAEVLRQEGIRIEGRIRAGPAPPRESLTPQVIHETALVPLLAVMGKHSDNHTAEQVFKTIGAAAAGGTQRGGWGSGRRAVIRTMHRWGLPMERIRIDDGSGLSRQNRLTAIFVTELLVQMFTDRNGRLFRESLAVGGADGTMRKRLRGAAYRGRVWAKTGTLAGARALSGYVHTRDGRWRAFSFLVNNHRSSVRSLQEEFCRILVDE